MKRPIFLMFKTDKNRFQVFHLVAWKVRTEQTVVIEDGEAVCNCQLSRFEVTCPHQKAVNKACTQWAYGSKDRRAAEKPIKWQEGTPRQFIIVGDEKDVAVIHPEVGDLSLYSLLFLLTEPEPSDDIKNATGFLNPQRIWVEGKKSVEEGISTIDDVVLKAGRAVPALKDSGIEIEQDYDESLVKAPEVQKPGQKIPKKPVWMTSKRPDPKAFFVTPEVWQQLLYTLHEGGNTLITGPSGCGKSELAYIAAKALGMEIAAFNCGAMSEPRTTLIGNTHFEKEKGTWFSESRFVRTVKKQRGCVLLDEITRSERGAFNILLPLMDRQGYLALDEHEDSPIIKKGQHVSFLATANIGMEYTGTDAMDKALKDRFDTTIDLTFPPAEYEVKILIGRCPGLRAADASKLVSIATRQRDLTVNDGEFIEQISTRMLIAAGKRIGAGMKFDLAVEFSIANQFTAEGGDASERTKIQQIIQKGGK
jgi:nitric oxide reductase NorQ protein